jgi:GT2 family glycosyltransferase
MTVRPRLSVCIVTYERPGFLRRCLEALKLHTTGDVEVVVVDASRENGSALVAEVYPSAVYVHDPTLAGWMTRSRNEALRHVHGEIVSFLDDDVVVSPTWQSGVLDGFSDASVDAVAGRTRNGQPGEEFYAPPIGKLLPDGSLTEGFASLPPSNVEVDHGIGANMSFRRSTLAELGGFRDDYPGTAMREDTDIYLRVRRLGGKAVFSPQAVVDHLPAPHVRGERFDTRYKLYARRNHMVLLARDSGIRSRSIRAWISEEYRQVGHAPTVWRKLRRFGVTTLGIAWGAVAMLRQAKWAPTSPIREDKVGRELRATLST